MRFLPAMLILFRLALGPLMFYATVQAASGGLLAFLLLLGLLSDIFDGVIARRLGVVTESLRSFDSQVDTIFVVCVALCVWTRFPRVVLDSWATIVLMSRLQLFSAILDYCKFRRFSAYHAYSAKLAGLSLFLAVSTLFLSGHAPDWWRLALFVSLIGDIERVAISLILPKWTPDVRSVFHAWQLRDQD